MAKDLNWHCTNCTYSNPPHRSHCDSCGEIRKRDRGRQFEGNALAKLDAAESRSRTRHATDGSIMPTIAAMSSSPRGSPTPVPLRLASSQPLDRSQFNDILDIAAAVGQEPEEGSWKCVHCTHLNPPFMERCCACLAEPPPDYWPHEETIRRLTDVSGGATLAAAQDSRMSRADEYLTWACLKCTFVNKLNVEHCQICFSDRPPDVNVISKEEQEELERLLAEQAAQKDGQSIVVGQSQDDTLKSKGDAGPEVRLRKDLVEGRGKADNTRESGLEVERRQRENKQIEQKPRISETQRREDGQKRKFTEKVRSLIFDASQDLMTGRKENAQKKLKLLMDDGVPLFLKPVPEVHDPGDRCFLEVTVYSAKSKFIFFKRAKKSDTVKDLQNLLHIHFDVLPERQIWMAGKEIVFQKKTLSECGVNVSPMYFPLAVFVA